MVRVGKRFSRMYWNVLARVNLDQYMPNMIRMNSQSNSYTSLVAAGLSLKTRAGIE